MTPEQEQAIQASIDSFQRLLGDESFAFPETDDEFTWRRAMAMALNTYEQAKTFQMSVDTLAAIEKDRKQDEWDAAYARAVGSSESAKKKIAESDVEWRSFEQSIVKVDAMKRNAEKWHSIAYQRLETLREVYKKR